MTYEEVMKKIDYLHDLPDYDRNPYCLGNRVRYWAELKKHFDKYRWHDLRKNPDDLPKENGKYLCIYSFEGWVMTDEIVIEVFMDGVWGSPDDCPIIAWREIEPFEEVEE